MCDCQHHRLCTRRLYLRAHPACHGWIFNAKVAGSWYPKEIGFEINGEQVTASTYCTGVVAPEGSRRILSMDLTVVQSNMAGATMKVRLF